MSDTEHGAVNGELTSTYDQCLADAVEELEALKRLVEAAEMEKTKLLLEKMDTEDAKKKAQLEATEVLKRGEQLTASFNIHVQQIQDEFKVLESEMQELLKKVQSCKGQLKTKNAERDSLQQRFKIKAQIPEKRMKFTRVEKEDRGERDDCGQNIHGVFTITQRPSTMLKGGQALLTFEEEKVAEQILKLAKCTVSCDKDKVDARPYAVTLEPSAKFEVHINVSKMSIEFSNALPVLPEERMRDRLELSFSKPSRDGGEVEMVEYDRETGKGRITFVNTGVAETLSLKEQFYVDVGKGMEVNVGPVYEYQLKKFQVIFTLHTDLDEVEEGPYV